MKKYLGLVLIPLMLQITLYADAIQSKTDSFSDLEKFIYKLPNLDKTLIVMDDDDTLTMMECDKSKKDLYTKCQYLGGPAWYAWQEELLENYLTKKEDSPYRVASSTNELINISTLLFRLNKMPYTDKKIPTILSNLTSKGAKLLVETARGSDTISATTSQFENLKAGNSTFKELISKNALTFGNEKLPSLASPFLPSNIKNPRGVSYENGVMYIAGQNKGLMLEYLLSKNTKHNIKNIVFIDDTLKNVSDVYKTFKPNSNYKVYSFHYTAFDEHKDALTKGENKEIYQFQANQRWLNIKNTLTQSLLQPNIK